MEKKKYTCTNCKFPFARFEKPPTCPYCSKPTVIDASYQNANDFLKELDDYKEL